MTAPRRSSKFIAFTVGELKYVTRSGTPCTLVLAGGHLSCKYSVNP